MKKYRKLPVVIEAFRLGHDPMPDDEWWGERKPRKVARDGDNITDLIVPTLEGDHYANPGDWIIKGVAGECYPCRHDIFLATYEAVDGA